VAQIYHPFPFTTCFGLMRPSSGTLGFYNRLFLFLLLSPHWPVFTHWECVVCTALICPVLRNDSPIRPKHVVKASVWYICATNCVDGNCNKTLSYTQYDSEVQHFYSECLQIISDSVFTSYYLSPLQLWHVNFTPCFRECNKNNSIH
jgi:hypothetical protein